MAALTHGMYPHTYTHANTQCVPRCDNGSASSALQTCSGDPGSIKTTTADNRSFRISSSTSHHHALGPYTSYRKPYVERVLDTAASFASPNSVRRRRNSSAKTVMGSPATYTTPTATAYSA